MRKLAGSLLVVVLSSVSFPAALRAESSNGSDWLSRLLPTEISLDVGLERNIHVFYTRTSGVVREYSFNETVTKRSGFTRLSDPKTAFRAVYALSSKLTEIWKISSSFGLRAGWRLDNSGVERGVIRDFPDRGLADSDPRQAFLNETSSRPKVFKRQVEYSFSDTQFTVGLYPLYFENDRFSLSLGLDWGASVYDLQLFESNPAFIAGLQQLGEGRVPGGANPYAVFAQRDIRITNTRDQLRTISHYNANVVIKLSPYFPRAAFFCGYSAAPNFQSPLKIDKYLRRANGDYPGPLYMHENSLRFGIRWVFQLADSGGEK